MTEKAAEKIERLRARIQESEEISDADRDVLMDFSDHLYLLSSRYSNHRHEHLVRRCTRMAEEVGGLADALEDLVDEFRAWSGVFNFLISGSGVSVWVSVIVLGVLHQP